MSSKPPHTALDFDGPVVRRHGRPTVVAVATADLRAVRPLASALVSEVTDGSDSSAVQHLWRHRVLGDRRDHLEDSGVHGSLAATLAGSTADVAVVEIDGHDSRWDSAVLAVADRVVVVGEPAPDATTLSRIRHLFDRVAVGAERWLAVVHPRGVARPTGMGALRRSVVADQIINLRDGSSADRRRLARLSTDRGVGLVLSGGGARGFAHLGAYRALRDAGIEIDRVCGASMGAMMGAWIALHGDDTDLVPGVHRLFSDVLDYTLPLVGLVRGERVTRRTREALGGADFEDFWLPFSCVSTNLTTSTVVLHDQGDPVRPLRATVAVPGIFSPVPFGTDLLIDGGILNNLPVDVMRAHRSVRTVIGVDVAPGLGPRVHQGGFGDGCTDDAGWAGCLSVSGWQLLSGRLRRGPRKRYPSITSTLLRAMLAGAKRDQDRLVATGAVDLLLELDLHGVRLTDFDAAAGVAARGYESARPLINAWVAGQADGIRPEASHAAQYAA